ncbi:unnamed protein product [Ilex paraguariensis]|uniref:Uncharacterized protein n=1 Tax=Ilex paraguariensis TaxID=185542 RepID=A0ABC8TQ61_9AQUA
MVVVSALQFACTDDVSTNVDTAERLVRASHAKGANIILIQNSIISCCKAIGKEEPLESHVKNPANLQLLLDSSCWNTFKHCVELFCLNSSASISFFWLVRASHAKGANIILIQVCALRILGYVAS